MSGEKPLEELMVNESGNIDLALLASNAEAYARTIEEIYQMFDREVFDIIIVTHGGSVFAAPVAFRLNKPMAIAHDAESVKRFMKKGERAILIGGILSDGVQDREIINAAEECGVEVIRLGYAVEKSKLKAKRNALKGYVIEAAAIL